jgi:hypothetical protein
MELSALEVPLDLGFGDRVLPLTLRRQFLDVEGHECGHLYRAPWILHLSKAAVVVDRASKGGYDNDVAGGADSVAVAVASDVCNGTLPKRPRTYSRTRFRSSSWSGFRAATTAFMACNSRSASAAARTAAGAGYTETGRSLERRPGFRTLGMLPLRFQRLTALRRGTNPSDWIILEMGAGLGNSIQVKMRSAALQNIDSMARHWNDRRRRQLGKAVLFLPKTGTQRSSGESISAMAI